MDFQTISYYRRFYSWKVGVNVGMGGVDDRL